MRIPSGSTDRKITFVAVDATDLKTRETGLTGFAVYRSRDGGAATAFTTPTVAELSAANMPGVYVLTVDEDTSLAAGHDTEEYTLHITQAAMSPVTRVIELYRPETTEGVTFSVETDGMGHADVKEWLGSAPTALDSGAVASVLRDGTHGGTAALLTLERIVVASTTAGQPAMKLTGSTFGAGLLCIGGPTGVGIGGIGGSASGNALDLSTTSGDAISAVGSGGGRGITARGDGASQGILAAGGATGHGFEIQGGATSGDAFKATVTSGNEFSGSLSGSIGSLGATAKADVNAEVDTALDERNLNDLIQLTGTISDASPAAGNFDGDAGLSATDDFYNGMILVFTAGTLAGISRRINDYVGASKNIVLENSFPVVPTNGDAFSIIGVEVMAAAAPGSGDWTSGEKENIRSALGVTGTKTAASGGQLQDVKTETDKLTLADAGAGVAGSIIEEIENRATPTQVNTEVDNALNTAIPGSPTADSINERLKRLEEDVTPTRAGNLDNLDAAVSTRATPAQVNTEVVDVLVTDTYPEPTSPPPATASLKDKIGWNTALSRNKITQTSTTQTLRNDADSANIGTSSVSDDGTTATRDEWV